MSILTPTFPRRRAKSIIALPELVRWANDQDTVRDQTLVCLRNIANMVNALSNRSTTGGPSPVTNHASSHTPFGADPLTTVVPTFGFSTVGAVGVSNAFVRSDATLAIFDATVPAALAATAAVGSAAFAARRDHVHLFPSSLLETTNSKKLTLTSTTTISTLTSDVATLLLAGATAFNPSATNIISFGSPTLRWLAVRVGTSGINTTGGYTQTGAGTNTFSGTSTFNGLAQFSGGLGGNLDPTLDGTGTVGTSAGPVRWGEVATWILSLTGAASAFSYLITASSTPTADRQFVLTLGDANRTLTLTGNPTLADWFDQDVKTTGSPIFVGLTTTGNTVLGNATTDTIRFNAGGNASAPATNAIGVILDYYGTSATRVLTTPNRWQSIIGDDGNTYKIALYS